MTTDQYENRDGFYPLVISENFGIQRFFFPEQSSTGTSDFEIKISSCNLSLPQADTMSIAIDGEIISTVSIDCSIPSISIDDFRKKYLADSSAKDLWEQFEKDLSNELSIGKISKIKYYRIVNKLTQKELAHQLHTDQPNVVRIEKVGYTPNLTTIKKLGKIFKIDYKGLLE